METTINISSDFNIPKKLEPESHQAWSALIEFLHSEDPDLIRTHKNEKIFSRDFKDLKEDFFFQDAYFFIHHNHYDNRLKKWFSYEGEDYKRMYNFLKNKGYFVERHNTNVSGIFKFPF